MPCGDRAAGARTYRPYELCFVQGSAGVCARAHRPPPMGARAMAKFTTAGLRHLADDRDRFGLRRALAGLVYRQAQRLVKLRINELMWRPLAGLDTLEAQPKFDALQFRALTPAEVQNFAADPVYELDGSMAERLERGHDWCFAALDGDRLVNYSWYALGSIESKHCHLPISFPPNTIYLYKAFTHPDFRGAGVHRATIMHAAQRLRTLELERVVLIVEFANWHSLHAHQRLGFRTLGLIVTAGRGPLRFEHYPPAARPLGLRFGAAADLSARATCGDCFARLGSPDLQLNLA
jgi:GNAT superfamily N-acetyltransferase